MGKRSNFFKSKNRRRKNIRPPKPIILIVCEGEKSEKFYFDGFRKEARISNVEIEVIGKGRPGNSLLKFTQNKVKNESITYDQIWIVFDKDDLSDEEFDSIVSKAIYRNKMNVAYSIPCFEYWLLLHFDYYNTPLTTKDCIKKLKNRFPVYRKNLDDVYYKLADKKYSAIENAKRMEDEHKKQGNTKPSSKNPSTLVYKLVIELEKFLK
ncbi:MAG: RloB domain-containing protein [Thermosipho sp. (in: Bacteria)]|nr:RloB domain-containing protein [Thermosipho sp. (in: thermotogales)]MCD6105144.1 RloB domain-containing protein [Thermosipho sp. (in: thermotogales)]